MTIKNFIHECQKKDVLKFISIYLVSTWVLLQVMAVIWEPIGLPKKSVTSLILLLLVAFPFYLYYIYKFKVNNETEHGPDVPAVDAAGIAAFKKMYFSSLSVIAVTCAFISILIGKANFLNDRGPNKDTVIAVATSSIVDVSDKIAVLKFGNNTGNDQLNVLGKMAADWIVHGINEKQIAQVFSTETIQQYSKDFGIPTSTDAENVLKKYIKPSKIISGNYFIDNDRLVLQASVSTGDTSELLISFKPQYCDQENPLECVESVKQLIMGYLFLEDKDQSLNLQERPPKFSSYEALLEAKANQDQPELYLSLLNKSITEDPNFFEPQVLRVAHYYGLENYKVADSLRLQIKATDFKNKRQANLLKHYEALIKGKNDQIYATIREEYKYTPKDLMTNSGTMTVALQYVNRPQDVEAIFNQVSMHQVDLTNCYICEIRLYVNALALIELGKFQQVIDSLQPINLKLGSTVLTKSLISAYVRSDQKDQLQKLFNQREVQTNLQDLAGYYSFAGEEALLVGDAAFAKANFLKTIELSKGFENHQVLEALVYTGDYEKSLKMTNSLLSKNPKDKSLLSLKAIALAKTNQSKQAEMVLASMQQLKNSYDYGATDYQLARYYAAMGNEDKALLLLRQSIASGSIFTSRTFQNDPYFKSLSTTPKFKKMMIYWH